MRGRSGCAKGAPPFPRAWSDCGLKLLRERIGPQLEVRGERLVTLAAFNEPRRAIAVGCPQASPLPACLWIVDAAVEALCVKADRIRHAQDDHAAVRVGDDAVVEIPGGHRHVVAEAEGVVLIDPRVVARFGAVVPDALETGAGIFVERPALGAVIAGGFRAV